jgi:exodeoxyribonuclease-3
MARGLEQCRLAGGSETRRGLPGDPDDTHSRYIETVARGITIGCLYLPNNPAPGPKFDTGKSGSSDSAHAASLIDKGGPVVLAGDYNSSRRASAGPGWVDDALFRRGPAERTAGCSPGVTDSLQPHPNDGPRSGTTCGGLLPRRLA